MSFLDKATNKFLGINSIPRCIQILTVVPTQDVRDFKKKYPKPILVLIVTVISAVLFEKHENHLVLLI